ncbi:putative Dual specificity protein phosphatase CDC14A [Blattamonas nauphoetae]|uniref:protein-tyrosine-phosphatase n=1 Tax=Blattamonas nauphoetae TaxID=2049346 RepID=A0ABQ9XCJ6_9EUKA|nr:putative Dual specificity protein phosphatase CDC14A [Blattamonas nauphoetae]
MTSGEVPNAITLLPDRLCSVALRTPPRTSNRAHFFTTDHTLIYQPFSSDFGPLNMSCLYRFCQQLIGLLKMADTQHKIIYYHSAMDGAKRANSICLVCSYCVLYEGMTADEAYRPFVGMYPSLPPFRDASYGPSTYNITVLDVLRGIQHAKEVGFMQFGAHPVTRVPFSTFDCQEYDHYERVENGDLNWIVPGKFIAFSGPSNTSMNLANGICTHAPEFFLPFFRRAGVTAVVRLNKKMYDRRRFVDGGIRHYDLYFVDGGIPSEAIVKEFISLSEQEGVVAVHCKAGLGRTGTLIACFMMKHFNFTANAAIGYIRVCRPGSIIGPQQHFLMEVQGRMQRWGEEWRREVGEGRPYQIVGKQRIKDSDQQNDQEPRDKTRESNRTPTKPSSHSSKVTPTTTTSVALTQTSTLNTPSSGRPMNQRTGTKPPTLSSLTTPSNASPSIDPNPSPIRGPIKYQYSQRLPERAEQKTPISTSSKSSSSKAGNTSTYTTSYGRLSNSMKNSPSPHTRQTRLSGTSNVSPTQSSVRPSSTKASRK